MGESLDQLAKLAAVEVLGEITAKLSSGHVVRLHGIGHSMGGVVLRAALPTIRKGVAEFVTSGGGHVEFGHYVSLSTPHLGIQCSWRAPLQMWRNLCGCSAYITQQLVQLAVQDGGSDTPPFLVALSDPEGPYVEALRMFQHRTCVTMANGDLLIPVASGVVDKELMVMKNCNPCCDRSAPSWHLAEGHDSADGDDVACGKSKTSKFGRHGVVARSCASITSTEEEKVPCRRGRNKTYMISLLDFLIAGIRTLMRLCVPKHSSKAWRKWQGSPAMASEAEAHASSARVRCLTWETSSDGACRFPLAILHGLETLPWRRKVAWLHHPPFAMNPHVFLIGKSSEQWSSEHKLSMQCINQLVEEVLLDRSAQ